MGRQFFANTANIINNTLQKKIKMNGKVAFLSFILTSLLLIITTCSASPIDSEDQEDTSMNEPILLQRVKRFNNLCCQGSRLGSYNHTDDCPGVCCSAYRNGLSVNWNVEGDYEGDKVPGFCGHCFSKKAKVNC